MPHVTLHHGVQMPLLGFGVFQIPDDQTQQAVESALEAGYRLIDTAAAYENERAVGRAIAASGIPRDELFVTTKLWVQDYGQDSAARAFDRSLDRLGLDHLDLYLIHQPFGDYYGAWRAMEDLNRDGRTRAIGVSNFYPDRLADLISHNEIVPAVNQIETHVFFQRTDDHRLMREYGVQHESWGPLSQGGRGFFDNPVLADIARAHGRTIAQIALRWLVQQEIVVIPKSVRPDRMAENLDIFDFRLTEDDLARIADLDTGRSQVFDHHDPAAVRQLGGVRFDT
ncbi:aldo/keto reductase [Streptomyces sp. DSM 44915]|uniref:Aldo/keto reductase n=1 Tax=Streptomyces chisholmiae TaxID=3075540 RepID=A0ABU2JQZ9_9ACTN|nr:aldo/keto reductase [Streptomyces sp. DSM 44915]MDT0267400.1 aldo/keto reductase [Streptomyces sp. DSM 44915]